MNKTEQWSFTHAGLNVIIKHWGLEREKPEFEPLNNGKGIWNYYVILPERLLKERFSEVWLEDKLIQFTPDSPIRITHDYMNAPFADVDWHDGITYYQKYGQLEGHRSVELGCDYSHSFDNKRNYDYKLDDIVAEAKLTAEQLAALYLNK